MNKEDLNMVGRTTAINYNFYETINEYIIKKRIKHIITR